MYVGTNLDNKLITPTHIHSINIKTGTSVLTVKNWYQLLTWREVIGKLQKSTEISLNSFENYMESSQPMSLREKKQMSTMNTQVCSIWLQLIKEPRKRDVVQVRSGKRVISNRKMESCTNHRDDWKLRWKRISSKSYDVLQEHLTKIHHTFAYPSGYNEEERSNEIPNKINLV